MWRKLPLKAADWPALEDNPLPFAGLLTSLPEEHDYVCETDGDLPDLNGTLYRIGPGLYDRGPDRKRMMLDGDGMVQALTLDEGRARFRNRFVRTEKYLAEAEAGRFLYPTFSCHGSGPMRYNFGLSLPNQANTTVVEWAGRIRVFDEGQRPFELAADLGTLGQSALDPEQPGLDFWAHWKLDAAHQQLHCLSMTQGPKNFANIVSLAPDGTVAGRRSIPLPRAVYIHDWFVTENYFALLLHPAFISPAKVFEVMIGRETFSEAIQWRPERGGVLVVAHRDRDEVTNIDTPACWMWHSINASEEGDVLLLDFIGGELGGGLGTSDSPLFQVMRGEKPESIGELTNFPRRYRVNIRSGTVDEQIIDRSANFELPNISATERSLPYTFAYTIRARRGELFANGLSRIDGHTLDTEYFEFGPGEYCGEPVVLDQIDGRRGRYVVSQVYRAADRTSYYAVFDEAEFVHGPVARIYLRHHAPLSFHGFWSQKQGSDPI